MAVKIFLSYSRRDSDIMVRVRDDLRSVGFKVWTDEKIEPGTLSWKRMIRTEIINADCLIAILSPDAQDSRWVNEELDFAETQGKPRYLLLARGDERTSIPFGYSTFQWIDIREGNAYSHEIERLMTTIHRHFGTSTGRKSPLKIVLDLLPQPFEWCEIPALTDSSENTAIKPFYIAKYPITNLQYQEFINVSDGYKNSAWWESDEEIYKWYKNNSLAVNPGFDSNNCPREMVNWYEAMAFCYWLSNLTGLLLSLPNQAQWRRAVQGDTDRLYPWGNEFDPTKCNTRETLFRRTTLVNKYPEGISPFGVMDLSGNVWEWSNETPSHKIFGYYMHGGGWRGRRRHTRVHYSRTQFADYRAPDVGFRIIAEIV
jgi:hypothetical protein